MATKDNLTTDAVYNIINMPTANRPTEEQPIVQIYDIKAANSGSSNSVPTRISINDGHYYTKFALLKADCYNALDGIDNFCAVKLTDYSCQVDPRDNAKKLAYISNAEIIASGATIGKLLGNPLQLRQDGSIVTASIEKPLRGEPKLKRLSVEYPANGDTTPEMDEFK